MDGTYRIRGDTLAALPSFGVAPSMVCTPGPQPRLGTLESGLADFISSSLRYQRVVSIEIGHRHGACSITQEIQMILNATWLSGNAGCQT